MEKSRDGRKFRFLDISGDCTSIKDAMLRLFGFSMQDLMV